MQSEINESMSNYLTFSSIFTDTLNKPNRFPSNKYRDNANSILIHFLSHSGNYLNNILSFILKLKLNSIKHSV